MNLAGSTAIEHAFALLNAALEATAATPVEMVVIGGAALNVLGIAARPTKDVDVLGLCETSPGGGCAVLVKRSPLPQPISTAAADVAAALDLDPNWLNVGPADLLDLGLPAGFMERTTIRRYGSHLSVHLPAREDLICLKAYAAADTGVGRHTEDLAALRPNGQELLAGVRWARTQDPSDGFRAMLEGLLRHMGFPHEAEVLARDS